MNQSQPFVPPPGCETGRAHRINTSPTRLQALSLRAQALVEAGVARVSVLADQPVYANADFPWIPAVEADWRLIRAELDSVMLERERLPSFHEVLDEVRSITTDDQWKTFWLVGAGLDCRQNAQRCPATMRALRRIPGLINAFFSILAPGKHVPAHRGAYNGVLRYHLGLKIEPPFWLAGIRVGERICHWQEGHSLVFDDSFNHEAWNFTEGWRVVLFVDFARPLHQPWHTLNRLALAGAGLLPLMRRAGRRHRDWQRRFYAPL